MGYPGAILSLLALSLISMWTQSLLISMLAEYKNKKKRQHHDNNYKSSSSSALVEGAEGKQQVVEIVETVNSKNMHAALNAPQEDC